MTPVLTEQHLVLPSLQARAEPQQLSWHHCAPPVRPALPYCICWKGAIDLGSTEIKSWQKTHRGPSDPSWFLQRIHKPQVTAKREELWQEEDHLMPALLRVWFPEHPHTHCSWGRAEPALGASQGVHSSVLDL